MEHETDPVQQEAEAGAARERWQRLLLDVSRRLALAAAAPEALEDVAEAIGTALGADRVSVYWKPGLPGQTGGVLAQWCFAEPAEEPAVGVARYCEAPELAEAVGAGAPAVVWHADAAADASGVQRVMAGRFVQSCLLLPLLFEGRLAGGVVVEARRPGIGWDSGLGRSLAPVAEVVGGFLARTSATASLQLERSRWQEAEAAAGMGYWEWCPQGERLAWSPGLVALLGLPGGGAGALQVLRDCLPVQEAERAMALLREVASGGERGERELAIECPGMPGEARTRQWLRLQAWPARGAQGESLVRGSLVDITAARQAEEQARAATRRLENLIANAPMAVYVCRLEQGGLRAEYLSPTIGAMLGAVPSTLPEPRELEARTHPADVRLLRDRYPGLAGDGQFSGIYRLRAADGSYRWIYEEANRVGADGDAPEVVGIFLDVTERKAIEAEVYASERRYKAIVEDAPAFICRYGNDLTLRFANSAFVDAFCEGDGRVEGRSWLAFLPEDERQAVGERLARMSPSRPMQDYEMQMTVPGRGMRWVSWSERGFFSDEGDLVEVQAVGRDNTELKEAQAKLVHAAKMGTVGEMATGMAHELNQPLNVIRMAAHNARRFLANAAAGPEKVEGKLDRIEGQVDRAAAIIDQMRMFGRKSDHEARPFRVVEAVENSLVLIREQFEGNGIELSVDSSAVVEDRVLGHRDQLEQVLMNLMINSRDAIRQKHRDGKAGDGPDWIRLSVAGGREADTVEIRAKDSGGGIDPAALDQLFEPFFTTKEVGEGTGLGLSVSFGIIRDMGGSIEAANTTAGAQFRICLPLAREAGQGNADLQ